VNIERPQFFGLLAGLFLAAGLVLAAMVVTRAWIHIQESSVISVTGSAQKDVDSDLVVWHGGFQVEDSTLVKAQEKWAQDLAKVETFLKGHNITNYVLDSVLASEVKAQPSREGGELKTVGYSLSQNIQFSSTNADEVAVLGRDSVLLVREGVLFTSRNPDFIYTRMAQEKVSMLAEATRDAKVRADQISSQGGRSLGPLRSARMGVFQITPRHSTETSSEGVNDLTSNEKTIHAVVSATFSLK
jgi:hypothetical protein